MMPKPLSLPRLQRQQMELDNLISSRCGSFPLHLPEHTTQIRLHLQEPITPYVSIAFFAEGRRGYAYLDIHAVAALLGEYQDPSIYPASLLAALLVSQLNDVLQRLSSTLETALEIDEIDLGGSCGDDGVCIGVQLGAGGNTGLGIIFPPPHILERILDLLAMQPAESSALPAQLSVTAQLLLAERRVTVDILSHLEPGDVLILPPGTPSDRVILRFPGYGACHARLDDQKLVVVTPMTSDMHNFSESIEETTDLGNLELTLEFHVGSLNLNLNELSKLTEGTAFDLGFTLDAPVSAKINGQTIARCELVDIDGRLGARIVRLISNKGEAGND